MESLLRASAPASSPCTTSARRRRLLSTYGARLTSTYHPEQPRAGSSSTGAMDTRHSKGLASSAKAQISLSPTDSLTPCYLPRTILSATAPQTQIDIKVRSLQQNLKNRRKKAGMFKCPRVSQSARQMEQSVWTTGKQAETLIQAQNEITL